MIDQEVPPPPLEVLPTSIASKYTTQERLLLAQAVYKLGALAWPAVSGLLLEHPLCVGRPVELFSPEGCEEAYFGLMAAVGQNV
jgi:bromodomain-containing protein 8